METIQSPGVTKPPRQIQTILAGIVGNAMEWYDFAIYGYFAGIIGRIYFPSEDATVSLIAAFGVFAAGFVMRPVGGLVFGHIGDQIGRKAALTLSVLAMAIPTFLIGILPGYTTLGIVAPILLVILRMIQGLSVGGEFTTSIVFLAESSSGQRRGFTSSWSSFGASGGTLLGSAVGALLTLLLSQQALEAWAWRIPFLLGLFVGLGGLYIRGHLPEPARELLPATPQTPILLAFREHWFSMIRIAGLSVLNATGFYIAFVYAVTYLEKISHLSTGIALTTNTISMIALLAIIPLGGYLSDRYGRRAILLIAALGQLLLSWPLFWLMDHEVELVALSGQLGFSVIQGLYGGTIPATMVEEFPARVRCSAVSIAYNVCLGILGGTAPMVATWLISRTRYDLAPAFYLMAAAATALVFIIPLSDKSKFPLT